MEKITTVKDQILTFRVGTLVAILAVSVSFLVGAGVCYEKIQSRLRHLDSKTSLYQGQFDALEKRVSKNDVTFAEIQKDIGSIKDILVEFKDSLKVSAR